MLKKAGAAKVYGIDFSKETIDFAKNNYKDSGCEFICKDILSIDIQDFSVPLDIIVSFEQLNSMN